MAETQVRIGMLGCADIAQKVSRAISLAPNTTVATIGSRSLDKAKAFVSTNNFPPPPPDAKIYGSYEAVLDWPLPTSLYTQWVVLAAQKKKHVLLEKPVALNVAKFDTIIEACDSNGVQFMDGNMWMHHPRTAKMREFLFDKQRFE